MIPDPIALAKEALEHDTKPKPVPTGSDAVLVESLNAEATAIGGGMRLAYRADLERLPALACSSAMRQPPRRVT